MQIADKEFEAGAWLFAGMLMLAAGGAYGLLRWLATPNVDIVACDLLDESQVSRVVGAQAKRDDLSKDARVEQKIVVSSCHYSSERHKVDVTLIEYPSNADIPKAPASGDSTIVSPWQPSLQMVVSHKTETGLGDLAVSFEIRNAITPVLFGFQVLKGRREVRVMISGRGMTGTTEIGELKRRARPAVEAAIQKM